MMEKVNPNQMALPGMENMSHPLARHLAGQGGLLFHIWHDKRSKLHTLQAEDPLRGREAGYLEWGDRKTGMNYPGEIHMIENSSTTHKGLGASMYRAGHEIDMGQDTVPVHSANRTEHGEKFAKKVGGPRPELHDYSWVPPGGIHPFVQQRMAERAADDAAYVERAKRNLHPKLFGGS